MVDSVYTFLFKKASKKGNVKTKRIRGLAEQIETVEKWTKVVAVNDSLILIKETDSSLKKFS